MITGMVEDDAHPQNRIEREKYSEDFDRGYFQEDLRIRIHMNKSFEYFV